MGRGRANLGILAAAVLLLAGAAGAAQTGRPAAGGAAKGGDQAGAEAHLELGKIYHRQVFEALDMAIKEYEDAVRLSPDSADAHYYLGLAYHSKAKLGSDDKAFYTKALQQYKLYLHYSPNGELAAKAKQNVAAVEALLGGQRAPAAKGARKPGGQR
jgi:tetratricopeptide (TPR) repeat protein